MKYKEVKQAFLNPEAMDRSAPFWSWNEVMKPEEVKNQAKDMIDKGMGGYFMHSRIGLESEYLGKDWMDSVQACVDQAKEDGTNAWLYDEDRWPSGAAGGLVTCDKENGGKGISIHVTDEKIIDGEILYTYAVKTDTAGILSYRLLNSNEDKKSEEKYLHVRLDYLPPMEWFNNNPPADNINKDTVKRFIEISYEPYKKQFGHEFGKAIPGIFTDEPNIASATTSYGDEAVRLTYTYTFPEYFKLKRGYDFTDILPALFMKHPISKKAKHDWFHTIAEMFAENYTKQIFDWCDENNLMFTGHWLAENRLGAYILTSGSVLLNYMYQHIPGIDMLRDQTIEYMTIKGCTSVAHQTGRKRALSETYGVSGWQFSFEGQKWIGDYQYIQGINLRCQHLTWYSMKGCRKRDYPPVFNYQTPWWKYNNTVEDYFARIGALTSKGNPKIDTLVIHPVASAWINADISEGDYCLRNMQNKSDELGFLLNDYTKDLMSNHIEFDYGDEDIMTKLGGAGYGKLTVGDMEYGTVIIPPMTETLYKSTVLLLEDFMNSGGKVIDQSNGIKYIEGEPTNDIYRLYSNDNIIKTSSLSETVSYLKREVSIKLSHGQEAKNIFSMVRDMGDTTMLFMINNDKDSAYKTDIVLKGTGSLEEWNPLNGEITKYPYEATTGKVSFSCEFGPTDSKIFMLDGTGKHESVPTAIEKPYEFKTGLGTLCDFERTAENVMVLDMCKFKYADNDWSNEDEIWLHQQSLRESLDMIPIAQNRGLQRYKWTGISHKNDGRKLLISFDFTISEVPKKTQLVIEDAIDYIVYVNNEKLSSKPQGWFVDKCMGQLDMPKLKKGINNITLELPYMSSTELENIYIIGDFGVSSDRRIIEEPKKLAIGDWGLQGYFHYHAGMKYKYTLNYSSDMGNDVILDLGKYSDVVTIVRINGHEQIVPWKAKNRVQVGRMLKEGANDIEIEVMGAPRNMFGPLHLSNSREKWTNSGAFHPEESLYTEEYITHPWGLLEQVCIYSR
ncbi:MAG: hypothetical protein J7L77_02525 [Clostridiales bacterium]|nr:hypothetical protein [Clostridiales bacterium]